MLSENGAKEGARCRPSRRAVLRPALLRTRPNWWQVLPGHERQPRCCWATNANLVLRSERSERLEGRPQAHSGWRRSSQGAWLAPNGLGLAHHGCPDSVIAGIHGQHIATSRFRTSVSIMDAQLRREASMGAEPCRQAWLGTALACGHPSRRTRAKCAHAPQDEGGGGFGVSDPRIQTSKSAAGTDSTPECLALSTAFAPACGHMTDRRRYRDSAATWPPSESRGDIRYLLCLREIVPRIHPLTPAFRGSFRFEHYPLTGAAESS